MNSSVHSKSVTVVIPAYNAARTIADAVDSVCAQHGGYVDTIVVVDDGSTDQTYEVASNLSIPAAIGLQVLRFNENQGPAAARNHGAQLAKTDWIAFLDADDIWESTKLSVQLAEIGRTRPSPTVSTTDIRVVDQETFSEYLHINYPRRSKRWIQRQFFVGDISRITPTLLIERRLFEGIGRFDVRLNRKEDHELMIRAVRHGRYLHIAAPLTINRVFPQSTRFRDLEKSMQFARQFGDRVLEHEPWLNGDMPIVEAKVLFGEFFRMIKLNDWKGSLRAFTRIARLPRIPVCMVVVSIVVQKLRSVADGR